MKIAIIQRFLPSQSRGGVGYFTHGLSNALVRRGHEVTVFTQDSLPEEAMYQSAIVGEKQSKWDPMTFPFQVAKENFEGFDVIHAQGDDQWIQKKGVPLVRTLHGSSFLEAIHNGIRRSSVKHLFMHLYFYVMELISNLRAGHIVTVSDKTRRYYFRAHSVIGNGIDLKSFSKASKGRTENPSILFVGQLHTRKRGHLLVETFEKVIKPEIPNAELHLICPEGITGNGITCHHEVNHHELVKLYAQSWVFCLPSSYEGFGRPYLEAMASGAPVVATANHGSCEILGKNQYGLVVSEKEMGPALLDLLRDQSKREKFAQKGLERVKQYDWDVIAAAYEAIYQKMKKEN